MKTIGKLLCMAALAVSLPSLASPIVLDHSPQAVGTNVVSDNYSNIYNFQNFAQKFSLGGAVTLDGMDIYGGPFWGKVGSGTLVTIWADNAGLPGSIVAQFATTISAIDSDGAYSNDVRKHANFSDFTTQAGESYWIGMAGNGVEIAQTALSYTGSGPMVLLGTGNPVLLNGNQMAFRLYGDAADTAAVPEPASLAIFGLGLAGMAALRRQRRG